MPAIPPLPRLTGPKSGCGCATAIVLIVAGVFLAAFVLWTWLMLRYSPG